MAPLVLVLGLGSRARFAGRLVMAAGVLGNSPLRWGVRGQGWRAGPLGWNAYSWLECDGACTKMATELVMIDDDDFLHNSYDVLHNYFDFLYNSYDVLYNSYAFPT